MLVSKTLLKKVNEFRVFLDDDADIAAESFLEETENEDDNIFYEKHDALLEMIDSIIESIETVDYIPSNKNIFSIPDYFKYYDPEVTELADEIFECNGKVIKKLLELNKLRLDVRKPAHRHSINLEKALLTKDDIKASSELVTVIKIDNSMDNREVDKIHLVKREEPSEKHTKKGKRPVNRLKNLFFNLEKKYIQAKYPHFFNYKKAHSESMDIDPPKVAKRGAVVDQHITSAKKLKTL